MKVIYGFWECPNCQLKNYLLLTGAIAIQCNYCKRLIEKRDNPKVEVVK